MPVDYHRFRYLRLLSDKLLAVGNRVAVVVHPFWNTYSVAGLVTEATAAHTDPATLYYLDSFNMLRRPSAVYQWLGEDSS